METSVYTLNSYNKGAEIERLDFQHRAVLKPMAGAIAPKEILAHIKSLGRPPVIADVGTGTGIWLRDLANDLSPDARLDGFDFDTSKFPDADQMPSNVKLAFGDALKTFPKELHGQYDVVHVRLLVLALKTDDWEVVAANVRELLRPGGYLFWEEFGHPGFLCLPLTEPFTKLFSLEHRYAQSMGRDVTAPLKLPKQMENVGFTDCYQSTINSYAQDEDMQNMASKVVLAGARGTMSGIVAKGGFDHMKTQEDADKLLADTQETVDNGSAKIGLIYYWTVGRNPSG